MHAPQHPVRFVTAASLFDGHDASINIMRRILQRHGAEVIHLGHNRSVDEVVTAAIQEDVQGVAVSSYQGGHVEYFTYLVELLRERGAGHVRVYGGGGGVIVPTEIKELHDYGVARLFSLMSPLKMAAPAVFMLRPAPVPSARRPTLPDPDALRRHVWLPGAPPFSASGFANVQIPVVRPSASWHASVLPATPGAVLATVTSAISESHTRPRGPRSRR